MSWNRSGEASAVVAFHARFSPVSCRSPLPSAPHTKTSDGAVAELAAKASNRPSAEAEKPFSTRSPPTIRVGASPLHVATRQSPRSPRSSVATITERPSGDQSGGTCRAAQERSSADVRQTASPPIAGIANVWMLRPKALRPGRAR